MYGRTVQTDIDTHMLWAAGRLAGREKRKKKKRKTLQPLFFRNYVADDKSEPSKLILGYNL